MHNGNLPGTFSANVSSTIPTERDSEKDDMKSENRTQAPKRKSFIQWLQHRVHLARAEEEEAQKWADELDSEDDDNEEGGDDWDNEDFDDLEYEEYDDEENGDLEDEDDEEEPEEFDDYEEEKELDFDDEGSDSAGRFADYFRDDEEDMDVEEPGNLDVGRLVNFYRMDDEDDEEDEGFDRLSDLYHMNDEEPSEEEQEQQDPIQATGTQGAIAPGGEDVGGQSAKDQAAILYQKLKQQVDITRDQIIEEFVKQLGITPETATSYYEDLAREDTGGQEAPQQDVQMDDEGPVDQLPGDQEMELSQEEIDAQDPNAQGIIRTVDNAHLVYKRQTEDGSFEELWIYNLGDDLKDALTIRREILNGTDIPRGHTRSQDGQQTYTLQTMGNAQMLHITGLSN